MGHSETAGRDAAFRSWGPDHRWKYLALVVAIACIAWRLVSSDPENRLVALVLAIVAVALLLVLVRVRVRLTASAVGISVTGPLRTRFLPWAAVESIETPRRGRFRRRAASLELEVRPEMLGKLPDFDTVANGGTKGPTAAPTGLQMLQSMQTLRPTSLGGAGAEPDEDRPDTMLLVFGALELGADPAAVGRALRRLRP